MSDTPQFSTAQYMPRVAGDTCRSCSLPITGLYYVANGSMLCASCGERIRQQVPQDSHAAFVRAIVFGLGGFAAGLTLYAGFTIATGIEIGFVSLAVGWMVGKAMMIGSKGVGGRRYQIAAVLLTYAAVSMAFIPIAIHYWSTHDSGEAQQTGAASTSTDRPAEQGQTAQGSDAAQDKTTAPAKAGAEEQKFSLPEYLGKLAWLGLASPFLQLKTGPSAIIGLFILFIGMRFAWRMTRGVQITIEGPYGSPAKA
jgi:hypothetical protein